MNQILNPEAAAWTIETGWRLMFLSAVVPSVVFALLVLLVPETPRYLAMNGQDDKALHVLARINGLSGRQGHTCRHQGNGRGEDRAAVHLRLDGYLRGHHAERWFQQAVGINAVLYFAPRIF